ncbi:MAG: 3'-5' exonuclease, partial [Acidimicrobiales bacterium]
MVKRYFQVPELILGFDTETTGLSVASERAISYGFSAYRFGLPVWSEQFFVIPDRPISPGAYRVHHLSLEDLEAKRDEYVVHDVEGGVAHATDVLRRFHERGAYVVGSNVSRFDLEMLRRSSMSLPGSISDDATQGLPG